MLISLSEFAKRKNMNAAGLRRRATEGTIPAFKIGRNWVIDENAVLIDHRVKTGNYKDWRKKMKTNKEVTKFYDFKRLENGKKEQISRSICKLEKGNRPSALEIDGEIFTTEIYAKNHNGKYWEASPSGNLLHYQSESGKMYCFKQEWLARVCEK